MRLPRKDNVYLMLYPRGALDKALAESPQLKRQVWDFLNGISPKEMLNTREEFMGRRSYTSWRKSKRSSGRVPAAALADLLQGANTLSSATFVAVPKQLGII